MAKVFRLATKDQSTSTYDFLTGYLRPSDRVTSDNGDGWVTETMTLVARASDTNTVASAEAINTMDYYCNLYWRDASQEQSVWLEEHADAEPEKRALINTITLVPLTEGKFTPQLGSTGSKYILTIIRSAVWERVSLRTTSSLNVPVLGGTMDCPSFPGGYDARIEQMRILSSAISLATANTIWGGIRPTNLGTTDFNPLWELESGSLLSTSALASDSDNASPIGTTDNIVTYACDTSETTFLSIAISQVKPTTDLYSDHYQGDYLVLCRAKLSAAEYVRLKMRYGFSGLTTYEGEGQTVYFNSTDWHLYEMGVVSIPPFPRYSLDGLSYDTLDRFQFRLRAMRPGASAVSISVDCLVLIPFTHSFKIVGELGSTDIGLRAYMWEDGTKAGYVLDADSAPYKTIQFSTNNWTYPVLGGVFVLAAEDTTGQSIASTDSPVSVALYFTQGNFTYAYTS
jgi:hypothetical protein